MKYVILALVFKIPAASALPAEFSKCYWTSSKTENSQMIKMAAAGGTLEGCPIAIGKYWYNRPELAEVYSLASVLDPGVCTYAKPDDHSNITCELK